MATKKPEVQKLEIRYRFYTRVIEMIGMVVHGAVPWVASLGIALCLYLSIRSLAGKVTLATILVQFLADVRVRDGVAYVFGLGGIGFGVRYRKLRRDTLEQLTARIKSLESQIDPRRSTSRLTPRGETRPEDRP